MSDTVTVTLTRAECGALARYLRDDAQVMHQWGQDAFATLEVLDLRGALAKLEAAERLRRADA